MRKGDILGMRDGEKVICTECLVEDEWLNFEEDDYLTEEDRKGSDQIWFCDRCNKRISG